MDAAFVKRRAKELGADLVGIASAATLNAFPPDPGRGEKLVLDIDRSLCDIDRIEKQPLNLVDAVLILIGWLGAGNADRYVGEVRPHLARPRISRTDAGGYILAGRKPPA